MPSLTLHIPSARTLCAIIAMSSLILYSQLTTRLLPHEIYNFFFKSIFVLFLSLFFALLESFAMSHGDRPTDDKKGSSSCHCVIRTDLFSFSCGCRTISFKKRDGAFLCYSRLWKLICWFFLCENIAWLFKFCCC